MLASLNVASRRRGRKESQVIEVPDPFKQVWVYDQLLKARSSVLHGVLSATLLSLDPDDVRADIEAFAPKDARKVLASAGIRDEHVFATPVVLRADPRVLGYYRLLSGISTKQFYTAALGTSMFTTAETRGVLTANADSGVEALCTALNKTLATLVLHIGTRLSGLDIEQLPLLTLGAQFDGAYRNIIGQNATKAVFESIREVVKASGTTIVTSSGTEFTFVNAANRSITVRLSSDPDVSIREETAPGKDIFKVAIEIKGGTDRSNVYNRAGEAEKSHQKVRNQAKDFWTCISLTGTNKTVLSDQAPTTTKWFDVTEVSLRIGPSWDEFVSELSVALAIPTAPVPPASASTP